MSPDTSWPREFPGRIVRLRDLPGTCPLNRDQAPHTITTHPADPLTCAQNGRFRHCPTLSIPCYNLPRPENFERIAQSSLSSFLFRHIRPFPTPPEL